MIHKEKLIEVLLDFYSSVEQLSDSVFVCERTSNGRVYQKCFYDISDNFLSYDLDSYLKQYVSAYYFKNNNELQWNFYVIFLTDQQIGDKDRQVIEENMDYARKSIVNSDDLLAWLNRTYLVDRKKTQLK